MQRKKLWEAFRNRIIQEEGRVCFTCDKSGLEGGNCHGGHFITGATCPPSLFFDRRNVHIQCYHCNVNKSGNWVEYERRMLQKYGQETVQELKDLQKKLQGEHWSAQDYRNRRETLEENL